MRTADAVHLDLGGAAYSASVGHLRRTEKSKEIKCEEGDLNPHGCLAH